MYVYTYMYVYIYIIASQVEGSEPGRLGGRDGGKLVEKGAVEVVKLKAERRGRGGYKIYICSK